MKPQPGKLYRFYGGRNDITDGKQNVILPLLPDGAVVIYLGEYEGPSRPRFAWAKILYGETVGYVYGNLKEVATDNE